MARQYQDTETRRRQVAEAALHTIAEDGVSRFTTRAVAERVGISDGTLFRHFGNKKEIVLEAMSVLEEHIQAGFVSTGSPMRDLEQFFRQRAKFVGAQSAIGALIFSSELLRLAGDEGRFRVSKWRKDSVTYLSKILNSLISEGLVRDEMDVQGMNMLVQGALLTFVMGSSLQAGMPIEDDADDVLERQIEAAWNTLQSAMFLNLSNDADPDSK